jgi:predicted metal-dependent hydrolase
LVDGVLRVMIPAGLSHREEERWVAEMRGRIERKTAAGRIDLARRARILAARFDLPLPVAIGFSSRQRMRWGSCSPRDGRIRISDRLAGFPSWVTDYVIVHELAHLRVRAHSPRFWELVNRYPLAERARGYLLAKAEGDAAGSAGAPEGAEIEVDDLGIV